MRNERRARLGSDLGRVLALAVRRAAGLALGVAITLSTTGCTLSLSPLAKHTAAFSMATATLVDESKNAYLAANKLHLDEQTATAIDSYGSPGWSPYTELKPLLTPEQLAARTKVLDALKAYADGLAGLTETKDRDKKLQNASSSAGSNLASLSAAGGASATEPISRNDGGERRDYSHRRAGGTSDQRAGKEGAGEDDGGYGPNDPGALHADCERCEDASDCRGQGLQRADPESG